MKTHIIKLIKTDLFKASFLNGIANIIKILTGLVSNKVVALYLGPSGIALLGQFQNFASMVMSLANVGINSGVTKYIAEYHDNELRRKEIITTGFFIIVIGSVIGSIYVFIQRFQLSTLLLNNSNYHSIFTFFAITLILFAFNSFVISILNGFRQFRKYVIINISSSIISLIIAIIFIIQLGLYGAFLGWILAQSLILFVTLFWVLSYDWFSIEYFIKYFKLTVVKKLLKFSIMTIVSIFTVILVQLQVRTYLIDHLSIQEAGYWQGIVRICDIYISFITTTLSIYYLPKLSEIKSNLKLKKEIFNTYKFILPLLFISSLLMYILREYIVELLFSKEFTPMYDLFLYQILGNIFKVASWLISYLMIAKAMLKLYILTEIGSSALYYFMVTYFVNQFGIIGATYAYCYVYIFYFFLLVFLFRKILFSK